MGLSFHARRKAKGLIPDAKVLRDKDRDRSNDNTEYHTTRWRKLRLSVIAVMPVCPDPFNVHGDRVVPSKEVHHIVPINADKTKAFDKSNLIALCQSCHKKSDVLDESNPNRQRLLMRRVLSEGSGGGRFSLQRCLDD